MLIPAPIRVSPDWSPLNVSGLVEWFDFRRNTRKQFLQPRSITNVITDSGSNTATITCAGHGCIYEVGDGDLRPEFKETVFISGLTGFLADLNGQHSVIGVSDADTLVISSSLSSADTPVVGDAFLDTVPRRVSSLVGVSRKFSLVGKNDKRDRMPYDSPGTNRVNFHRVDSVTPGLFRYVGFMQFDSWPTNIPQPFTLFCAFYDPNNGKMFYYASFIGSGTTTFGDVPLIGINSTSPTNHQGYYAAGGTYRAGGNVITRGAINIFAVRMQVGNYRYWKNGGTAILTSDPGSGGINGLPRINDASHLAYGCEWDMCDWLLYQGGLSAANINLVGNYLAAKLGGTWSNVT
jgi:hypothetical protein